MKTITSCAVAAAFASLIFMGAAFAQSTTTTPAPAASPAPAKTTTTAKPRSPESLECSKQADEKGLKGKERKKFRKECMKEAKDAAGAKKQ
jgi:hypothetical protein